MPYRKFYFHYLYQLSFAALNKKIVQSDTFVLEFYT